MNIRARLYKFSALGIFNPLSQSYITLGDFNWSKPAKSSWVRADLLQLKSPRVIYDWENGLKVPNAENLYNLALIFNEKMEDLLVMR